VDAEAFLERHSEEIAPRRILCLAPLQFILGREGQSAEIRECSDVLRPDARGVTLPAIKGAVSVRMFKLRAEPLSL
jgi:hypothetical protein